MEGFTFVEKSVYVCGRFTLVGGFTFDGVTRGLIPPKDAKIGNLSLSALSAVVVQKIVLSEGLFRHYMCHVKSDQRR